MTPEPPEANPPKWNRGEGGEFWTDELLDIPEQVLIDALGKMPSLRKREIHVAGVRIPIIENPIVPSGFLRYTLDEDSSDERLMRLLDEKYQRLRQALLGEIPERSSKGHLRWIDANGNRP